MLDIRDINFGYSDKKVICNVSFEISEGDFIGVIGPNGSGKSTLLKMLNAIYKPDCGEIKLNNKSIYSYSKKELARTIAMVPQESLIPYEFKVEEIVAMGRYPFIKVWANKDSRSEEAINKALVRTNTIELKNRFITELSGGERQRVYIARALAQEPKLLLLDEPTSFLDINHQMEILNLLRELNEIEGLTIAIVLHDINQALKYTKRLLLLDRGAVYAIGSAKEVITNKSLNDVYKMRVAIDNNKYTDQMYITPIEKNRKISKVTNKKIHVIGGGGSAQEVLNYLNKSGANISLGVVNRGDTDWRHARALGFDIVDEKPFSKISEQAVAKARKVIRDSDAIIVSPVPFGAGNIDNLKLAKEALDNGMIVYYVNDNSKKTFDYTEGEATKLLNEMKASGLIHCDSFNELIKLLD